MKYSLVLAAGLSLIAGGVSAEDNGRRLSMSTGVDYSTVTDSNDIETSMWYVPVTLNYQASRGTLKLTIPYLQVDGPATVVDAGAGVFASNAETTNETTVESGLGDIVAAATYYLTNGYGPWPFLDLTAKVKFATADDEKGLGSGENDYYLQLDPAKVIGAATIFGTLGYKIAGDTKLYEYNDVYYASLGTGYRLSGRSNTGLIYDYRQPSFDNTDEIKELTAYFSRRTADKTNVFAYVVKGYTDASATWAFGTMVSYTFD